MWSKSQVRAHAYNLSTQEADTGGLLQICGHWATKTLVKKKKSKTGHGGTPGGSHL